ncbi:MAG: hypothetical protein LAO51_11100 [Acidobacteriia bacterium]|nr:hypothetical protein [Terriglobia bacterium]
MRIPLRLVLALALVLGAASCAERRVAPGEKVDLRGLDRKLSTFAFIEEGKLVSFIVDTKPTRYREQGGYIPLEICVANRGLKKISLSRESFTLRDQEGNAYPCAEPKELMDGYEFLDLDRQLAELNEIVFNRFGAFVQYPSKFSPTRLAPASTLDSTLVRDTLGLPKFGYIVDYIYFQRPKTGVVGKRFELFMRAPELPDPVFVKFAVQ